MIRVLAMGAAGVPALLGSSATGMAAKIGMMAGGALILGAVLYAGFEIQVIRMKEEDRERRTSNAEPPTLKEEEEDIGEALELQAQRIAEDAFRDF